MSETALTIARPRGLVPGTREWLTEIEGPRVLKRVIDEIHAQPVGEMNPTGARLCSIVLDRVLPTISAVHHTIEGDLKQLSEQEIKDRLKELLAGEATDVEAKLIDEPDQQEAA